MGAFCAASSTHPDGLHTFILQNQRKSMCATVEVFRHRDVAGQSAGRGLLVSGLLLGAAGNESQARDENQGCLLQRRRDRNLRHVRADEFKAAVAARGQR